MKNALTAEDAEVAEEIQKKFEVKIIESSECMGIAHFHSDCFFGFSSASSASAAVKEFDLGSE